MAACAATLQQTSLRHPQRSMLMHPQHSKFDVPEGSFRLAHLVIMPLCRMLVVAQVVLAMQLPFTLIPLIKATSSKAIMGSFASSWVTSVSAWASSIAVSLANVLMVLDMLWNKASEQSGGLPEAQQSFGDWFIRAMANMLQCVANLSACML
jgi:hypothetical protein